MASDGGPASKMSVRDEFAKALASATDRYPASTTREQDAAMVYDFAQLLTDEKLRRDKADRDEGKTE